MNSTSSSPSDKEKQDKKQSEISKKTLKLESIIKSECQLQHSSELKLYRYQEQVQLTYCSLPIKLCSIFSSKTQWLLVLAYNKLIHQYHKKIIYAHQFTDKFSLIISRYISKYSRYLFKQLKQQEKDKSIFSENLFKSLMKVKRYDQKSFYQLSTIQLKENIENQLQYNLLQQTQLVLIVLNNHIQALIDINTEGQQIVHQLQTYGKDKKRSFLKIDKDSSILKRYQQILAQFQNQQQTIQELLKNEQSMPQACLLVQNYITDHKNRSQKIIKSRINILTIVNELINKTIKKTTNRQLSINDDKVIVEELDEKIHELSTISQQPSQLEAFKGSLDMTIPEHNINFTRIVNVMIQLHQRLNQLHSRRPQNLIREIEIVERECQLIQFNIKQFIKNLQYTLNYDVKPITFEQKSKSPQYFKRIQNSVKILSEHILFGISIEYQNQQKIHRIKHMIELYWNILSGMDEFQSEWEKQMQRKKTQDEDHIQQMLQSCLQMSFTFVEERIRQFEEQNNHQEEERLSRQNQEIRLRLQIFQNENQQLKNTILQLKSKQKIHSQRITHLQRETQTKTYTEKHIQSQSQLQHLKEYISTLKDQNKELKDNLKGEFVWKSELSEKEQTISQLNAKITQLNLKLTSTIEQYQLQLKNNEKKLKELQIKRQNKTQQLKLTEEILALREKLKDKERIKSQLEIQILQKQKKITQLENSQKIQLFNKEKTIKQLNEKLIKNTTLLKEMETTNLRIKTHENKEKFQQSRKSIRQIKQKHDGEIAYLKEKIRSLEDLLEIFTQQNIVLQAKIKQLRQQHEQTIIKEIHIHDTPVKKLIEPQYKVQGDKLQLILQNLQHSNVNLNQKVQEILTNSRMNQAYVTVNELIEQNRILIQEVQQLLTQRQQITLVIKEYPKPQFLTEFVFKVITYFAQLHPQSPQAKVIWEQLQNIRSTNRGGQYFVILEEYVKYVLEENVFEIYRQQLRNKTKELEILKVQLDNFFKEKLQSQKHLMEKKFTSESRIRSHKSFIQLKK